jgi:serine phosphatase RsbU (regulator of sigma subunit)/ligand-binding sensor domain-containing protein
MTEPVFAQFNGYPIRNYTPKEYNGFTQNWDCVQDKRGVMYFGNSSNILEYDGKNWRKIPVAPGVAVRSLFIDSLGVIYVGAVGEFGFLAPQRDGKLIYRSLSANLPDSLKQFADVWKIHGYKQSIVFQTSERLFFYKDKKMTIITPTNSYSTLSFIVGNNLYVRERQKGLMKLSDNNKMVLIKDGELFYDQPILGIIKYGSKKLILTGEDGFYLMDEQNKNIEHLPTKIEKYLNSCGVLGLQWFNDSIIYINSRAGLIFLNRKLEFQKIINKSEGLNDETLAQMFIDKQKELWLSTNNGISRVSINSPLYYYNNNSGFNGNIQAITIFKNQLFLGTTVGMFSAELNNENKPSFTGKLKFLPVEGTFFECWNFHEQDGKLLAATSDGVFEITGNRTKRVTKPYANDVSASDKIKGRFYISEKGGMRIMQNTSGSDFGLLHYFEFTADDIMTTTESPDSGPEHTTLWLTTRNSGIFKLDFDENYKHTISRYNAFDDVVKEQVQVINKNNELYFCTAKGAFKYDQTKDKGKQNCFVHTVPGFYTYDQQGVHLSYWDSITHLGKRAMIGMHALEEIPYTFYQDNENVLWIGLTNELVRFDGSVNKNYRSKHSALIRKTMIAKDSVLFHGTYSYLLDSERVISDKQQKDQIETLPYKYNSITFEYSSTFYEREEKTMYSYKLVGFDTAWSSWSTNNLKQYTNLFEGEYAFLVKSKNIYEQEGELTGYKFIILPPWYRTLTAYAGYASGMILLVIGVVKVSMRRLIVAKVKLEKIVTERTAEVVHQKEELQQKNNIIEVAYNDIKSSINYAKRIQESILPLRQQIKSSFPESFVLFKPRDVVSGDFYWFAKHNDKKIIACVDCTGHGVPGAFMSMIGNTLLNEIINEKNIFKPSDILNLLHERVRQSLKQDLEENETRDGMDIALCVIDEKKGVLEFAGANRPLYIIRNNDLEEIKPTKSPIGGSQMLENKNFINNEIKILPGDSIYMSTDGYADQFGGSKGKKFMVKHFQQKLKEIQENMMEEQSEILQKTIEEWQGQNEQVDDILIIGIKI